MRDILRSALDAALAVDVAVEQHASSWVRSFVEAEKAGRDSGELRGRNACECRSSSIAAGGGPREEPGMRDCSCSLFARVSD